MPEGFDHSHPIFPAGCGRPEFHRDPVLAFFVLRLLFLETLDQPVQPAAHRGVGESQQLDQLLEPAARQHE
jgi:hypothetical protein